MSIPHQEQSLLTSTLVGAVLGVFIGICGVFHIAAVISSKTFGDGSLHASIADSGAALAHALKDPAHPADAWGDVGGAIPGPAAFWFVQAFVFGLFAGAAYLAWRQFVQRGRNDAFGVKRNVGVARTKDLRRLHVDAPQPGRITLGRSDRQLLAAEQQASLAIVGPTGCGKTAGFAIPALLEWQGPVIATSVKADLIEATVSHRRSKGKVWIYDPTGCADQPSSSWSPLAVCKDWRGAQQAAAWLCEAAQPRLDTVSDGDYWYTQARKALPPYLLAAATTGRTMADVVAWIDNQEQVAVERALRDAASVDTEIDRVLLLEGDRRRTARRVEIEADVLAGMRDYLARSGGSLSGCATKPVSEWPTVACNWLTERLNKQTDLSVRLDVEAEVLSSSDMRERVAPLVSAQALWSKDSRVRDSVFATVENVLAGYADPAVGTAPISGGIDFEEWLSGDNTIYVVATSHEQARLRPALTVVVQQAVRAAFDTAARSGGRLSRPCLILLDEAGNTAPLRDLPTYASTARSHGISLVSVWQDLAQVKAIYRDRAQTVLNNHRAKLFGTGIADDATLEYVSRLIGDVPETQRNFSRDLSSDRRSVSEHTSYRRAAPVDVLRRIRTNEAVLVYGSELPAHIHLRPWYSEPALRALSKETIR